MASPMPVPGYSCLVCSRWKMPKFVVVGGVDTDAVVPDMDDAGVVQRFRSDRDVRRFWRTGFQRILDQLPDEQNQMHRA